VEGVLNDRLYLHRKQQRTDQCRCVIMYFSTAIPGTTHHDYDYDY